MSFKTNSGNFYTKKNFQQLVVKRAARCPIGHRTALHPKNYLLIFGAKLRYSVLASLRSAILAK
jgi:uncharacterized protein YcbX